MSKRGHGQLRRSQIITTYGPGALIDLPGHAGIIGGLDTWPHPGELEQIDEPRLARKLELMTGVRAPRLYAPPPESNEIWDKTPKGIGVWRFPEWFVVQETSGAADRGRSRRLVHRKSLDDQGRFEKLKVVPTRFVRGCPRGHVDDLAWHWFVHGSGDPCPRRQLWLDEQGTTGDLGDLRVRCECGKSRPMSDAAVIEENMLGTCQGKRPWLGSHAAQECRQPSRLLIRTAVNAYFSQVVSVLSLPDRQSAVAAVVAELWDDLEIVDSLEHLELMKKKPRVAAKLEPFDDQEVLEAIRDRKRGPSSERPVKQVELEALLVVPEGYGEDIPVDQNFHARRLPEAAWRKGGRSAGIQHVVQLHRLREVLALAGFTRFEAVMPDIQGEYETDVERAELALEPKWFPAVENRGEGVFLQLDSVAVHEWLDRIPVKERIDHLHAGHQRWCEDRKSDRDFPGGTYLLLHTLSHLLIQSLAMRCGYPASSIRERIYSDADADRYGILLYTASPDAEGTLGGLVQQARHIEAHLRHALHTGALCSNDPICAQHTPGQSMESRWLHGAACHGCVLVAETSCEMRNDYLDRALVTPTLSLPDAAFFRRRE